MSLSARVSMVIALLSAGGSIWAGCGVDATEVEGCQKIEEARCEQAPACPSLGITTTKQVEACKRFYRDQCLHGLAVDQSPGGPAIERCVTAIQTAGKCAQEGGKCTLSTTTPASACQVIEHPEYATDCAFLLPAAAATTTSTADAGTADAADAGDGG